MQDQIDYDENMSGTSALIMNDPATHKPISPIVELGIRGLDNLTNNMIGGGLYILIAETPSARFPVLAGSIGMALKGGLSCTVIVPSNPESFIQRIEAFDKSITPDLITSNRLRRGGRELVPIYRDGQHHRWEAWD